MTKIALQRAVRLLGLSCATLLAFLAVLLFALDLGQLKYPIAKLASHALQRELRIEGALSIRLGRTIHIDAEDLVLANAPWASQAEMIRVRRLAIALDAWSVFAGPIHLASVSIEDGAFRIASTESGETNWRFRSKPSAPESTRVRDDWSTPLIIDQFDATELTVLIDNPSLTDTLDLHLETIQHRPSGARLRTVAQGQMNGIPLRLDSDLGPRDQLQSGGAIDFRVQAAVGEIGLDAFGNLDRLFQPQQPLVEIAMSGPNAEYLFRLLNLPDYTQGPLDLNVRIAPLATTVELRASGTIGEYRIGIDGNVDRANLANNFDWRFSGAGPDADRIGSLAGFAGLPALPFSVQGRLTRDSEGVRLDAMQLNVGDTAASIRGTLDALPDPQNVAIVLVAEGKDASNFRDLLRLPHLSAADFDLRAEIRRTAGDPAQIQLDARVGNVTQHLTATLEEDFSLSGSHVSFSVAGPDSSLLGANFGQSRWPAAAFAMDGEAVYLEGMRLSPATISIVAGDDRFELRGNLELANRGQGTNLQFDASGPDLGRSLQLLGLPYETTGPYSVTGRLRLSPTEIIVQELEGRIDNGLVAGELALRSEQFPRHGRFALTGQFDDLHGVFPAAPGYLDFARPVMAVARGTWSGTALTLEDSSIDLGSMRLGVSGSLASLSSERGTDLALQVRVPSLAQLDSGQSDLPDLPLSLQGHLVLTPTEVVVQGLEARIGGDLMEGDLALSSRQFPQQGRFNLVGRFEDVYRLIPAIPEHRYLHQPVTATARGAWSGTALALEDSQIELGGTQLTATGALAAPSSERATDLAVQLRVPSLAAVGFGPDDLPDLPLRIEGQLIGSGGRMRADNLVASVGNSEIRVGLSLDAAEKSQWTLALSADTFDLRPFLPRGSPDDSAPGSASLEARTRLIPEYEFPLERLRIADLEAELRIDALITHLPAPSALNGRLSIRNGQLEVRDVRLAGPRGVVSGGLSMTNQDRGPELQLGIRVEDGILALASEPTEVFSAWPPVDLNANLRGRGTSLGAFAASLNGQIAIGAHAGTLPLQNDRMAGFLFGGLIRQTMRTINPLATRDATTQLQCAVLVLDVQDGIASGDPAVLVQTSQLNIIASGQVDLETENLDMDIVTQARRGLRISVSDLVDSYVRVSGTLAAPTISVDPLNAVVRGGVDVATGGITLLTRKLRERFATDRDACAAALAAIDTAAQ